MHVIATMNFLLSFWKMVYFQTGWQLYQNKCFQ